MSVGFSKLPQQGGDPRAVASAVNLLIEGKLNSTGCLLYTSDAADD